MVKLMVNLRPAPPRRARQLARPWRAAEKRGGGRTAGFANPKPETRNPKLQTRNPNPKPSNRNPKSRILNPDPQTRKPKRSPGTPAGGVPDAAAPGLGSCSSLPLGSVPNSRSLSLLNNVSTTPTARASTPCIHNTRGALHAGHRQTRCVRRRPHACASRVRISRTREREIHRETERQREY
jgi:hypothetical protein